MDIFARSLGVNLDISVKKSVIFWKTPGISEMYRTFATSTLSTNSSGSKLTPFGYNLGVEGAKVFEES
jgi:hypothetical protein